MCVVQARGTMFTSLCVPPKRQEAQGKGKKRDRVGWRGAQCPRNPRKVRL